MNSTLKPIPYSARRDHFFSQITRDCENSIAIVPAHPELVRNDDVDFPFRQDSSFKYLTGFDEPDAIAVFLNLKGKKEYILFVRPKDLEKEIWTGYRCGVDAAVTQFQATKAYPIAEFEQQLLKLLPGVDRVYYSFFRTLHRNGIEFLDEKIMRLLDQYRKQLGRSGRGLVPIHDLHEILGEMRLFKSPEEVERLRRAGEISAFAHKEAMCRTAPGLNEAQIEALLEFVFKNNGCARHGYGSIVASGIGSTILHYRENNKILKDGDLLLIDAAGEFDHYTADITRTYPINGKFTAPQRELYDIVLRVQKECIRMAKPGATLVSIHDFAVDLLTDAMLALGFLSGDRRKLIENLTYKRYYPHGTGHLLGMDVHDIGLYRIDGQPRRLEPGMCFTVEPGFYVLFDDMQVPEKYRGIGIRIEDDVLITQNGCEVFTQGVPKEIDEIQNIVGSKPWPTDFKI